MYTEAEQKTINKALTIVEKKLSLTSYNITNTKAAGDYGRLKFGNLEHEVFAALMLTNQHTVITTETLFRGTIDGAAVYPREVIKSVLSHNAAAVIFVHNHPSGITEPSSADQRITQRLQAALEVIEVRVLDHLVVSAYGYTSMAERGLL